MEHHGGEGHYVDRNYANMYDGGISTIYSEESKEDNHPAKKTAMVAAPESLLKPPINQNKVVGLSPSKILKMRILNEVKMIIAGRKVLKGMRTNVHLKEALIDRYF
jgi:hypothetical protein